ncbi:hypothetical protein BJX96DRAFT_163621 [Aspergillus floccosus]
MGSGWSSGREQASDLEQPPDPVRQSKFDPRLYGNVVPSLCGTRLDNCYTDLYEEMYFVQHQNQECIVAFQSQTDDPRKDPEERSALAERTPRVYQYLARRTNAPDAEIDGPIDVHPRIVNTIWVRKNLSITLSGFVNATIPSDEWPYSPYASRYEAEIYYTTVMSGDPPLDPKIDLSDWATFVWRCMRNDLTARDPTVDSVKRWALPTDLLDPTEMPGKDVNPWEYHIEWLKEGKLQLLEEERCDPIFEKVGVRMEGEDEVLPDDGRNWEDIFTVVREDGVRWSREIRYKSYHPVP